MDSCQVPWVNAHRPFEMRPIHCQWELLDGENGKLPVRRGLGGFLAHRDCFWEGEQDNGTKPVLPLGGGSGIPTEFISHPSAISSSAFEIFIGLALVSIDAGCA